MAMEYTQMEKESMMIAGGAVVFSIIAIATFVLAGGGIIFYIVAFVALAIEIYMAYRISQEAKIGEKKGKKQSKQ